MINGRAIELQGHKGELLTCHGVTPHAHRPDAPNVKAVVDAARFPEDAMAPLRARLHTKELPWQPLSLETVDIIGYHVCIIRHTPN